MLNEKESKEYRNQMEAVSFNAWQQLSAKGALKKGTSFEKYKKQMGLGDPKSSKIGKQAKKEVVKTALTIHQRVQRLQNVKQKNI